MSDNKIVEMFDSIPKFDYFSKYSFSLQKVFNNCSLKNLIKELKSPKKKMKMTIKMKKENFIMIILMILIIILI